jgi:hypothetical protein
MMTKGLQIDTSCEGFCKQKEKDEHMQDFSIIR